MKHTGLASSYGATGRRASRAEDVLTLAGTARLPTCTGLLAAAGSAHPGQPDLAPGQQAGTSRGQAWMWPHLQWQQLLLL